MTFKDLAEGEVFSVTTNGVTQEYQKYASFVWHWDGREKNCHSDEPFRNVGGFTVRPGPVFFDDDTEVYRL